MASEAGLFVEWFGKLAKKKKRAKSTAITAQRNDISASPAYSNNRQQRYASSNTGKMFVYRLRLDLAFTLSLPVKQRLYCKPLDLIQLCLVLPPPSVSSCKLSIS